MLVKTNDLGDGVRLLVMDRPPANAINAELNAAIYDCACEAGEDRSVRAVIVTGTGRFFSAGLDLNEIGAEPGHAANVAGTDRDGPRALWMMPKPTVAMINGHAIAGGLVIALACDFRITCFGAHQLGLNEIANGLPLPADGLEIARLALAPRSQRHVLLEAALFGPERALELEVVDEIVAPAELKARAVMIARRLAALGQLAYAHTKRAMRREALARLGADSAEQRRERLDIMRSEEARALVGARLKRVSKK